MITNGLVCLFVVADPKAHVGDGVHFHDFTFAPESGANFN